MAGWPLPTPPFPPGSLEGKSRWSIPRPGQPGRFFHGKKEDEWLEDTGIEWGWIGVEIQDWINNPGPTKAREWCKVSRNVALCFCTGFTMQEVGQAAASLSLERRWYEEEEEAGNSSPSDRR